MRMVSAWMKSSNPVNTKDQRVIVKTANLGTKHKNCQIVDTEWQPKCTKYH